MPLSPILLQKNGGDGIMSMKLFKQILSLLLVIALFFAFNISMYFLITIKCSNNFGTTMQAKTIEVENYLPFEENSEIVKINASLKITEDIPVLDGATALLPVYSAIANAVYPEDSCHFDGENFSADSSVQYHNTKGAYKAVVDGEADIVFCAAPSEDQLKYAKEQGVELVFLPIGYEAFVFLVNAENPVDSLSQEQIRSIYSGEYTNWSEVGGANRIINPLTRQEGSGSQTAMLNFMEGAAINKSPFAFLGGSIGFSFRYYVEDIVNNDAIKMLSVDDIYPSEENIRNGSYPIVNEIYAVYRADNNNENVDILLDWILSEEGQQIINQSGYVGIN